MIFRIPSRSVDLSPKNSAKYRVVARANERPEGLREISPSSSRPFVYEHTKGLEELGLISRKPSGRSFALATTRYFAEFFGLKSTDREGIRKIMAQKAGVPYTERSEATSADDLAPEASLPAPPPGDAVAHPAATPAAAAND